MYCYWCIIDIGFKFQPDVRNGCHDLLMMSMNPGDIAILNTNRAVYRCIISGISKSEAISFNSKHRFDKKNGTLQSIKFIIIYKKK